MRGGAFRVGKGLLENCARLVHQEKLANEINRFFSAYRPCFSRLAPASPAVAEFAPRMHSKRTLRHAAATPLHRIMAYVSVLKNNNVLLVWKSKYFAVKKVLFLC